VRDAVRHCPPWPSRRTTRYSDSTETTIVGFTEDADPATGTLPGVTLTGDGLAVWREEPVAVRRDGGRGNAAVLGWSRAPGEVPPTYRITLPAGWTLHPTRCCA
jgi:hypothetical protein